MQPSQNHDSQNTLRGSTLPPPSTEARLPLRDDRVWITPESVNVEIFHRAFGSILSFTPKDAPPTSCQLQELRHAFEIAIQLIALDTPAHLIAEALLNPVFASQNVKSDSERRQHINGMIEAFTEQGVTDSALIQAPITSNFMPGHLNELDWLSVKRVIVDSILSRAPSRAFRPCPYSEDDVAFIHRGVSTFIGLLETEFLSSTGTATWAPLRQAFEMAIYLAGYRASKETVVAALFTGLYHLAGDHGAPAGLKKHIEAEFGGRVDALIDAVSSADQDSSPLPLQGDISKPPLVVALSELTDELRPEAATLAATLKLHQLDVFWTSGQNTHISAESWASEISSWAAYGEIFLIPGVPQGLRAWYHFHLGNVVTSFSDLAIAVDAVESLPFAAAFEKLFRPNPSSPPIPEDSLVGVSDATEVGCRLLATGAPSRFILEGFLHPAFWPGFSKSLEEVHRLANKNIRHFANYLLSSEHIPTISHEIRFALSRQFTPFADYKSKLIEVILSRVPESERVQPCYSEHDIGLIVLAIDEASRVLFDSPVGQTPRALSHTLLHFLEVGFRLMSVKQPTDVVIAGFLHDVYEIQPSQESALVCSQRLRHIFGDRVHELIEATTEPKKDPGKTDRNFFIRKTAIVRKLNQISMSDPELSRDASIIICSSKLATLSEGFQHLKVAGSTEKWSQGNWMDNVRAMAALYECFRANSVPPPLLHQYHMLVENWAERTLYRFRSDGTGPQMRPDADLDEPAP